MARTQRRIERDMVNAAIRRGVGSYIGAGSVLREIIGVAAYQVSELENKVNSTARNAKLSEATGVALDAWGRDLRLPRVRGSRAYTYMSDLNVRVFTSDGSTFDSLPGGAPALSIGDRLYSTDQQKAYIISQAPSSLTGLTEVYVGVRAVRSGSEGNIKPYDLSVHTYSAYEASVKVENRYAIYNGHDTEPDVSYRERLLSRFIGLEACNSNAIRTVLNGFAGVGKFNIINNYAGAGTTGVIVQPTLGITNTESVLAGIRGRLAQVPASGARIIVKNPLLKQISIESVLRTREPLNATQKALVVNRINRALLRYFNSLQVGEDVSIRAIENLVRSADEKIISIGDSTESLNSVKVTIGDGVSSYEETIGRGTSAVNIDRDELAVLLDTNPIDIRII